MDRDKCGVEVGETPGNSRLNALRRALCAAVLACGFVGAHGYGYAAEAPETRENVLDFLRKLRAVVEHDDLGDRAFIEQTLGVNLVKKQLDLAEQIQTRYYIWPDRESFGVENLPDGIAKLLVGEPRMATQYYSKTFADGKIEAGLSLIFPLKDSRPDCIKPAEVLAVFGKWGASTLQERPSMTYTAIYRYTKQNRVFASFSFDLLGHCLSDVGAGQNHKE